MARPYRPGFTPMNRASNERPEHPAWLDYEWLARDAIGQVAVFTTGGPGPIPASLLRDRARADVVAERLASLPRRGGATLFVSVPRPDDFVRFGEQGLFSYDWADTHRVSAPSGRYEICARPERPILTGEMPADCRVLLEAFVIPDLRFDQVDVIDVRAYFDCEP